MTSHSFEAHIVNGQVVPAEALKPFEGQRVQVTVSVPEPATPVHNAEEEEDIGLEPGEDMDVEKDVYVPMPLAKEVLAIPVLAVESRLKPCLILPEDLPDE